jgi:ribosomal RNA-processing protein RRP41/SKI6 (EC 3.1.13.-)
MVDQFPRAEIDVFIEVLQADAGTRIAGLDSHHRLLLLQLEYP